MLILEGKVGGRKLMFFKIFLRKYYNILNFVANISVTLIYTNWVIKWKNTQAHIFYELTS
jgi:hypothetical protein